MAAAHVTPHHPPYAMMIGEAIREIGDVGGTTASAISDYITSHFDGLPWAHHRLFPYFLRKLVASGEFVEPTPGRFLLSSDPRFTPEPPPPATAVISAAGDHDEPVLQPRKKSTDEKIYTQHVRPLLTVVTLMSPTSIAPPPPSSTTNADIVIEEHRRNYEATTRVEIGRSNAPQVEEPLAMCSTKKRKLGVTPWPSSAVVQKKRRRGRPPKSSSASVEEAKEAEVTIVTKSKKRRGRPPKSNPEEAPLPSSFIAAYVFAKEAKIATKSRRIRPSKSYSAAAVRIKRRGLPPKSSSAAAGETKEVGVTIKTKTKKRRGRPPKSNPEAPLPSSYTASEAMLATKNYRTWPAVDASGQTSAAPTTKEQTLKIL